MAYAALISLKHAIEPLTNRRSGKDLYESLKEFENVLKQLDDSRSSRCINRSAITALDAEIRDAAYKLQDLVESDLSNGESVDVWNAIYSYESKNWTLRRKLQRELDYQSSPAKEDDDDDDVDEDAVLFCETTVGLLDDIEQIKHELLDWESGPQFVSLYGMAGIGKTHLAKEICKDEDIVEAFDGLIVVVRVGPRYRMRNILVEIVSQVEGKPRRAYMGEDMYTIVALVQKCLDSRRYLIVLDDVWSTRVCNTLIWWLPINEDIKGRRVILTTRLEEVAKDHSTRVHHMCFLNNEESWKLFGRNVFDDEDYYLDVSSQLEKVGRKIAENCEGLPLLILAVAGILSGQDQTEEYWSKVAEKKTSTFPDAYDIIAKVLFSSYDYLPQHLRAFFLYMAVFPQSCEIRVLKLIRLLAVERFIETDKLQNIDYFAMEFLKELVSNSLAIVCKQSYNGTVIKTAKLHSAYWYLCAKEARREKFFLVLNKLTDCSEDFIAGQRRLCVQNNILFGVKEVYESMAATTAARSLLCTGPDHEYPVPVCMNLRLLKVLDALAVRFYEFPTEVVKLLQLRYLALTHNGKLPSSITQLQELESLILRRHHNIIKLVGDNNNYLPKEIWDVQELRHLRIMGSTLPDPRNSANLPNLYTLDVNLASCTKGVFRGISHRLEKLSIKIELQPAETETLSCFDHIGVLERLETLKCVVVNPRLGSGVVFPPYNLSNLPRGLKKLSLNGLGYSWWYMREIGKLPLLKVLKLRCSAFQGLEWQMSGEFESLELLLLEDMDLVRWKEYEIRCFPHLQRLIIRHCYKLEMIPPLIGALPDLKIIELDHCRPSLAASAQKLRYFGNFSLQVLVTSSWN